MKKDLREPIMSILKEQGEITVNVLHRKLGCNKNNLIETYKNMIEQGYITARKQDNETVLGIKFTDMDKFFSNLDFMINQSVKVAEDCIRNLKNSNPIFQVTKKGEKSGNFTLTTFIANEKDRERLGLFSEMLNNLGYYSLGLIYANSLNLIQEKFKQRIPQYHKKCAESIRKITEKLINDHKEDEFLKNFILSNIHGLTVIENIQSQSQTKK